MFPHEYTDVAYTWFICCAWPDYEYPAILVVIHNLHVVHVCSINPSDGNPMVFKNY